MKPRYVVINERERNKFEKKWHLPYGYGECEVFTDIEDAIKELKDFYNCIGMVVEEITDDGRSIVYRGGLQ